MPEKDYGAGIDRLNELITADLIPLVDPAQPASVIGWGAMLNVQHLVHGLRALDAAGCSHAAIPVVRMLFEYSVGLLWLADAEQDAADVLNIRLHGAKVSLNRRLDANPGWRAGAPPESLAIFDQVRAAELDKHKDQNLLGFANLLEAYGLDELVPYYGALSEFSHFTSDGAQLFFREKGEGFALSLQPMDEVLPGLAEISFGLQFDSMCAYNRLLLGEPWTDGLARVSKDFDQPIRRYERRK